MDCKWEFTVIQIQRLLRNQMKKIDKLLRNQNLRFSSRRVGIACYSPGDSKLEQVLGGTQIPLAGAIS